MSTQLNPLSEQQLSALGQLTAGISRDQLLWLNGYFQGLLASARNEQTTPVVVETASKKQLKILFGTHTGRSKTISSVLAKTLANKGVEANIQALDEYKVRQLASEKNIVFIVSTHGEGEPPTMAEEFYGFITGKRAPKLPDLNYSVVALGDKSYKHFCKTGIDIDLALSNLGAKSILPVLTLDVDLEDDAERWINQFTNIFSNTSESSSSTPSAIPVLKSETYSRKNPFKATVIDKVKITGRTSEKEVYHVELSLEGSGITYEPGDSVGIWANNPPQLVDEILGTLSLSGDEKVQLKDDVFPLRKALTERLEITILNREVIQKYQERTQQPELLKIAENEELMDKYLYGHDIMDLLQEFPFQFSAQDLVEVLRNFPPRLYSISSSQDAVGEEVHITVATVRYTHKGRSRGGACSTYLADRIDVDSEISIFIEKNPAFKLPEKLETPVILIGAGTGVAPFRSFLQHREANNLKGKTWLFFGERRFHSDFLYQLEWQKLLKDGFLEKIDVAFSRDQEQKMYVQHRLFEKQQEVFQWLNKGAHIYLCGDMKQMARDVQETLLRIFEAQGGMTNEKALEYMKTLKKEKRFQLDVY